MPKKTEESDIYTIGDLITMIETLKRYDPDDVLMLEVKQEYIPCDVQLRIEEEQDPDDGSLFPVLTLVISSELLPEIGTNNKTCMPGGAT